ncbi:MAG TPA: dUTP diphosphatase [Dehalococcoidia bacterium]|nr:dUTP diphosphatase [Dehalococcoidia bacterium]
MSAIIRVKRLRPDARLPQRATPGATGFDLYACLGESRTLEVGPDPLLVPTGIAIEAPPGFDVQVRPRSGLSLQGVQVTFGTIDADYRGEVLVTMYTVGSARSYSVSHGERIAQLVVSQLAAVELAEVAELSTTVRGGAGHGSTGRS